MTTEELLNQLGVSLDEARTFILNNVSTPEVIYNIAAQNAIGFDMLAEILDDPAINAGEVRSFFNSFGLDTSSEAPVLSSNNEEPTTPSADSFDLSLEGILDLESNALATGDWGQLITDYQNTLNNFDWSVWGDQLTDILATFDWSAWASSLQDLANQYAQDGSWLTDFKDWYETITGAEFDSTFSRSDWTWDDTDSYLGSETESSVNDLDLSAYADLLASYGISLDSGSSFPASITDYLASIGNGEFDINGYIEFFNSVNFDDYIDNIVAGIDLDAIAARYSNMDWSSVYNAAPVAPTGVVEDLPMDLI
ncbi:hypothetical protein MAQ5080_00369 [Marinomonas aquimarina]|uniref:Uncharacterized protein n=1 Tax=Marinomonas aquimarina TaxID=295068 RepID=A0A1A8T359_9GAMM|nr:hypothetical protein [Marinomonas aquimarina]SBS25799.1 hypothetical protein MAQ5080_00369 [Marinomonas aquimarina]